MIKKSASILITLLLISSIPLLRNMPYAAAKTWIVDDDGPADFHTIQEAITASSDGDTILVRNGTYTENLIINKKVSLIGEDKTSTIIDGNADGNVVLITSSAGGANLSSFTLRNGQGINDGAGIDVRGSGNHTINNNIITDNQFGLRLYPSHYNVIYDNEITLNLGTGIELRSSKSNSIFNNTASENGLNMWIIESTDTNIVNNSVTYGDWGITLYESPNSVLRNNSIWNNYFNFHVWGKSARDYIQDIDTSNRVNGKTLYFLVNKEDWEIDSFTFPDVGYLGMVNCKNMSVMNLTLGSNIAGILLANTSGSVLENLQLNQVSTGIDLEFGSNNNTIRNNVVSWSEMTGIYLNDCCNNSIYQNQVACLNSAIRTVDSSNNNLIYHNTLIQSHPFQISLNSINSWDDGYPSGGNYWSNYAGVDVKSGQDQDLFGSDGIGDTPYTIDADNADNYALMKPYAGAHDLGLKVGISKTVIGYNMNATVAIRMTIVNYGVQAEDVNFTYQIDTTVGEELYSLMPRNSSVFDFLFDTTNMPKGNYTVSASVLPVQYESGITDNFFYGTIIITIPGDINGDKWVEAKDAIALGKAFYPLGKYNPRTDINDDGLCNAKDAVILGAHFDEHWE